MRTPYKIGRDAEYSVKRMLEARGYSWIIRSAASHTPIDLLAANGVDVLAVQVKKRGYMSKDESLKFVEWARQFNAKPVIALKRGGRWTLETSDDP